MNVNEPNDILPGVERIADDSTRVATDIEYIAPVFKNPLKVVDITGKVIGAAVISLALDRIKVELFLDPHTPEAFDVEVETGRARIVPHIHLDGNIIDGTIVIE